MPDFAENVIDIAGVDVYKRQKLGCPMVETVSTAAEGLKAVVDAAVAQSGKIQRAPYVQGDIDLTDKKVVEEADRKRFAFVNSLVSQVEKRKVLTKDKALGDDTDFEWLMIDASHAVSYTHLDVYKRQILPCIGTNSVSSTTPKWDI